MAEKEKKVDREAFEKEAEKELSKGEPKQEEMTVDVTEVLNKLQGLPDAIDKISTVLEALQATLEGIQKQIAEQKDQISALNSSLGETKKSLEKVREVQEEVEKVKKAMEQPVARKSVQGAEPVQKAGDRPAPYEIRARLMKSLDKETDPFKVARLGRMIALIEAGGMPGDDELREFGVL